MKFNILVVDDEEDIRNIVSIYLENSGYTIYCAENAKAAMDMIQTERIDLILLDIMLPDLDGVQLCMQIRKKWNVPIIMLSAKDQDMDKVMGLSAGADDYLAKPFNPVELLARVRAQLRRFKELNPSVSGGGMLKYEELSLLLDQHKVMKGKEEIRLTPTEYKILLLLWQNRGIVFSTDHIFERVWGEDNYDVDNTVMVHIRNLREKIEDNKKQPQYIQTVWGLDTNLEIKRKKIKKCQ